jgi:hypothetical protein
MTELKVKNDALNFRSSPTTANSSNIIGSLTLAQTVELTSGDPNVDRFLKVKATVGGTVKEGFASAAFLRPLVSAPKEALISAAAEQWLRFDRGTRMETDNPQFKIISEYWKALDIDGDGNNGEAWSAAFISFVARQAGYSNFRFNQAHAVYVHDAVDKRKAGDISAPFWGFNVDEHKPQLGDLVCKWRPPTSPIASMDELPDGGYSSHCDIVFEIKDTEVRTLGGNVKDTVRTTSYLLDSQGFLVSGATKVYGVLRNNL